EQNRGYCYCLKAYNKIGSTWATNNPPTYPHPYWKLTPLCPPTGIGVDGSVCGYNKVVWQPNPTQASATDGYNIYRSLTYGGCGASGGTLNDLINGVVAGTCELVGQAGEALITFNPLTGADTLVGWWKMNENSWSGINGEVWDSSGKKNHGTAYGNAFPTTGYFKKAGSFDGDNDYLEILDSDSLSITGDMTIEAWVKVNDYTTANGIVGKTLNGIAAPYDYYLLSVSGIPIFCRGNGIDYACVQATNPVPTDSWHHLAVTMNGTTVTHYLDGKVNGSGTLSTTIVDADGALRIGNRDDLKTDFNGLIDNLAVYNYAKSAAGILKDAEAFPLETTPTKNNNTCSIGRSGVTALPIYCPNQTQPPADCVNCTGDGNFCFTCGGSNPNCCRFYDKRIVPNVSYFYQITIFTRQGGESPPSSIPSGHL
ncbi:MAG: LamG domain-containing protein, partial [Anaerolineales bacterium]